MCAFFLEPVGAEQDRVLFNKYLLSKQSEITIMINLGCLLNVYISGKCL